MVTEFKSERLRAAVSRNEGRTATACITGAFIVGIFISLLLFFAHGERRNATPVVTSPATTAPVTQPRTATPPPALIPSTSRSLLA